MAPAASHEEPVEPPVELPPVMVYYEGEILNIFFHPLVARPEIAFKGNMKEHFLEWFVTAEEYKKILDELYERDYVLADINEFYTVKQTNGVKTVEANKLLIPEGKKPLILSVDDLSYYEHCRKNGIVHKLVLDQNGDIAAWTDTPSGGEISYDLDIVTITEDFIKKHPDFSIRNARGIIALTGYEGILGYQTHAEMSKNAGYQKEIENAIIIVNKLKELGWRIASHSWGHLNMPKAPMSWFTYDNKLWDKEVKPILGETDLYIYPFGAGLENMEEKHKILRDRNFNLFFGVGSGYGYRIGPKSEYIFLSRRNIDGQYFRIFRNSDKKLFDIDKVMDKQNRGIR
ncbi:MAG: hypothetical protein LBU85_00775 [Treponema sp.]|nr:hypothetical protein [Treponema sp.]